MAIGDSCSLSRCRYRLQGHGQGRLGLGCLVCHTKGFFAIAGGVVLAGIIVSLLVALWGVGTQYNFL